MEQPCYENFLNKTTELAATQSVIAEEADEVEEDKPAMIGESNNAHTLFHT